MKGLIDGRAYIWVAIIRGLRQFQKLHWSTLSYGGFYIHHYIKQPLYHSIKRFTLMDITPRILDIIFEELHLIFVEVKPFQYHLTECIYRLIRRHVPEIAELQ